MRINSHAHIFNLQTVLTHEAVAIIARRVRDRRLPEFVVEAVRRLLDELVDRPENLNDEALLARFVAKIAGTPQFKSFVAARPNLPIDLVLLGEGHLRLGAAGLRKALDELSTALGATAVGRSSVFDVYETLRIALKSSIVGIADHLLRHMDPDDAIVALMMDISSDPASPHDTANFGAQIRGTSRAALQRPGRILPFVAVNPRRLDHFEMMRRAIEELGFVGLKLYPSLGYEVGSAALHKVFEYCLDSETPIVTHCSRGGFYANETTRAFSSPTAFEAVLKSHPDLRVCFAHCGGEEGLMRGDPEAPGAWTAEILRLMHSYPNVYMDIAFHTAAMAGGAAETDYLSTLEQLVAHPVYRHRILFGTDSWLLRLAIADDTYWQYYLTRLSATAREQMMEVAPRRFLGLPTAAGAEMRANIRRFVAFIDQHRHEMGADPTPWLRQAAGGSFTINAAPPEWDLTNNAHFFTYTYALRIMNRADQALGFPKSADLRLQRLTYWQGGSASVGFAVRCRGNAIKLTAYCRAGKGTYEGTYDDNSAVAALAPMFASGDATLAELASAVDSLFRFPSEDL